MPVWFFILLAVLLAVAVVIALSMGVGRRSAGGGQNTTIVERRAPATDRQDVTIVEGD